MTPQELLAKAADEIARTGHHKDSYSKMGVAESVAPVCAYGAMTRAATDGMTTSYPELACHSELFKSHALIDQAAELLAEEVDPGHEWATPFSAITRFNDDGRTTGEDVILAMKKAAGR